MGVRPATDHGVAHEGLLPASAVRVGVAVADWREALRVVGGCLVDAGITSDAYTDEMIATVEELGPYIVIAPGIALAHARPSPAVHRFGLGLVTLDPPIPFGHQDNDPVRIVIGLAAPDNEGHIGALASLAGFLDDDERRQALLDARDARAVSDMFAAWRASELAQQESARA